MVLCNCLILFIYLFLFCVCFFGGKGNRIQSSTGPIKDAILKHKTRLSAELVKLKIKKGVRSNKELQIGGGVGGK